MTATPRMVWTVASGSCAAGGRAWTARKRCATVSPEGSPCMPTRHPQRIDTTMLDGYILLAGTSSALRTGALFAAALLTWILLRGTQRD